MKRAIEPPSRHGTVIDEGVPVAIDPADDPIRLRRTRRRALAIGALLLMVTAALAVVIGRNPTHPAVQGIDDAWNRWMTQHRDPLATAIAKGLSVIGSAPFSWAVRIAAVGVLLWRRRFVQAAAFATAIAIAELAIGPLKSAVDRPRPLHSLVATTGASFPSGHAIAAAVTAFGLVAAFLPRSRARIRWTGVAAAFAASMAISRTYLAAHWLTDTIAGACMGVGIALVVEAAFEQSRTRWAERRDARETARGLSTAETIGYKIPRRRCRADGVQGGLE